MVVKINQYYKLEIDKSKGVVVNEDYTLKSPYIFVFMYLLAIFYNFVQLSNGIYFVVVVLYTLPILLGTIYEFYKLIQYKKDTINIGTIKQILELGLIRIINILSFMFTALLMCIQLVSPELFDYIDYVSQMNNLLIIVYFISIIVIFSLFLLGMFLEKRQVIKNKKKWFVSTSLVGILAVIGYFILKKSDYSIFILFTIIGYICLSYLTGRAYFRYKNFNKKVTENDKMIDYEL